MGECFASDQRKEGISAIDDTSAKNSDTSETISHEFEYVRFHASFLSETIVSFNRRFTVELYLPHVKSLPMVITRQKS
jgi:hypothetical protein